MKLFAKEKDIKEQVRESQREMRKGVRDIDREIMSLKREEEKLIRDIKAAAKQNKEKDVRVLAQALVRVRNQISKMHCNSAQLRGISAQMTTAAATSKVSQSMAQASKAMKGMNTALDPQKMSGQLQKFAQENAKLDMASEMMNDVIEDALDNEETEEESNELVSQVLDEIGVDVAAAMGSAPRKKLAGPAAAEGTADVELDSLEKRLAELKN